MLTRRTAWLALVPALALLVAVPARGDKPAVKPAAAPWYVDDDALFAKLTEKVGELAKQKKCLSPDRLKHLVSEDRTCKIEPTRPGDARLDPEDVYERALGSVLIIGSVVEEDGEYVDGRMATAWVLAADGVLVTNWHVFDAVEDDEYFGVMDRQGHTYPLTDVLAVNKAADVAVFKVAADGLTPLPVADRPARVGSWVGVLGHPGDRYFTFTQGSVSRYSTDKREDGAVERWMSVTADYAYGSSGSPVLDRRGAVVGMAAMTESLDYPDDDPPAEEKPKDGEKKKEKPTTRSRRRRSADPPKPPAVVPPKDGEKKPDPPAAKGSSLQMVVKLVAPASEVRKLIEADGETK